LDNNAVGRRIAKYLWLPSSLAKQRCRQAIVPWPLIRKMPRGAGFEEDAIAAIVSSTEKDRIDLLSLSKPKNWNWPRFVY
jgi:hypothetical protein